MNVRPRGSEPTENVAQIVDADLFRERRSMPCQQSPERGMKQEDNDVES